MSFSLKIKKEVLNQEYSRNQALEFLSGLLASSSIKEKNKFIIKMNKPEITSLLRDLLDQMKISHETNNENKNWIVIDEFELLHDIKHPAIFFAGIFVGGGSMSDPKSTSYHLELQFFDGALSNKVKVYLNKYHFTFNEIKRRGNWVLYIKKSEMITDFLRVIQAYNSLMEFEDERINRDFRNQLNRYSNLDAYNQQKLANATTDFMEMYNFVSKKNLLDSFNKKELDFFELKKSNKFLSLSELAKKYEEKTGIFKTRAGLNHYIYKLKNVYNENFK